MTSAQVSAGLAAPFGAAALMGKQGAIALLITLFMAVTSSSSSELIAVSSILTFDIYKVYVKPTATPDQLIFVSHAMICVFAVVMALFATIWNLVGISLGWLFLVMGLIIGGAVFPAAYTVCWRGQTKAGAIAGCLCGLAAGLIAWLVEAKVYYGELTVATTGANYPTLAGNMAGVLTGWIVSTVVSLIKPDKFDWEITRSINKRADSYVVTTEDKTPEPHVTLATVQREDKEMMEDTAATEDPKTLQATFKLALILSLVLSFCMDFLIPMPMFFTEYIFSRGFFLGWVIISFIWVFAALFICAILPVAETFGFLRNLASEVGDDLFKKKSPKTSETSS